MHANVLTKGHPKLVDREREEKRIRKIIIYKIVALPRRRKKDNFSRTFYFLPSVHPGGRAVAQPVFIDIFFFFYLRVTLRILWQQCFTVN